MVLFLSQNNGSAKEKQALEKKKEEKTELKFLLPVVSFPQSSLWD